jgi:hypothetical protein
VKGTEQRRDSEFVLDSSTQHIVVYIGRVGFKITSNYHKFRYSQHSGDQS